MRKLIALLFRLQFALTLLLIVVTSLSCAERN